MAFKDNKFLSRAFNSSFRIKRIFDILRLRFSRSDGYSLAVLVKQFARFNNVLPVFSVLSRLKFPFCNSLYPKILYDVIAHTLHSYRTQTIKLIDLVQRVAAILDTSQYAPTRRILHLRFPSILCIKKNWRLFLYYFKLNYFLTGKIRKLVKWLLQCLFFNKRDFIIKILFNTFLIFHY